MAERAVTVRILGDASQLERVFGRTARAGDELTNKLERQGTKLAAAGKVMTVGVTAPAILAFNKAADAASGLNEQIDATRAIFGDSAEEIISWSKTTAKSMGISQRAALQSTVQFGNMLQTAGVLPKQAGEMGRALVQLAADMASFNDQDPSEMLEKLRSGLAGEAEPLRTVGVFLSEATVKAKAMALGLGDVNGELTEAEKVQARYAVILEQSARQHGNFAATAESAANKQRVVNATAEDGAAAWGQVLLPALKVVQTALIGLGQFLARMPTGVKAVVSAFVGLAAITGPILLAVGKIKLMRAELRRLNAESGASVGGLTSKLGAFAKRGVIPATAAVAAAIGVYEVWKKGKENLERATVALTDAIKAERGGVADAVEDALLAELTNRKLLDDFEKAQVSVARAIQHARGEIELSHEEINRLNDVMSVSSSIWGTFTGGAAGAGEQVQELREAFRGASEAERQVARATREVKEATQDTAEEIVGFAGLTAAEFAEWRNGVVEEIDPVRGALEKLRGDAKVTSQELIDAFVKQFQEIRDWRKNLQTVIDRKLPQELLQQLIDMGVEGAPIVAAFANANDRQLREVRRAFRNTRREVRGVGDALADLDGTTADVGINLTVSEATRLAQIRRNEPRFHSGGVVPGNPNQEIPILAAGQETIRTPAQERELQTGIQRLGAPPASSRLSRDDAQLIGEAVARALTNARFSLDADGFVRLISDRIGRQAALTARTA